MILHVHNHHPSARSYVLKLHHDARPEQGRLCGRLEHIPTGDHVEFDSAEALLAWLAAHAARVDGTAATEEAP